MMLYSFDADLKEYYNLHFSTITLKKNYKNRKKISICKMRLSEVLWPSMDRLLDLWVLIREGNNFTFVSIDLTLNVEHDQPKTVIFLFLCH